jgi:hypothetical protein
MGRRGVAYSVLVGKPDRKRQLGQPKNRCEDDIKMDLQELGRDMDLIDLAQVSQAVMQMVIYLQV